MCQDIILTSKHAYLIICHNNIRQLKILLSLLDYSLNDIYIHFDKKSNVTDEAKNDIRLSVKQSNVFFIKSQKVSWGGDSLMRVEISLLKQALKRGYSYYHLISGSDLPLKSAEIIYNFFESDGHDFIGLEKNTQANLTKNFLDRFRYYYPFQNKIGRYNYIWKKRQDKLLNIQKRLKIDRTKNAGFEYVKGSQWFSVTHDTAAYIFNQYKKMKKYFLNSYIPDESFVQTIIKNSPLEANVIDDNMRYIDWQRGKPYTFQSEDFDELIGSNKMFARKFDESVDDEIIRRIQQNIIVKKQV